MDTATRTDWIAGFDELAGLTPSDREFLAGHAHVVNLPAGHCVFAPGKKPESFLLVLHGTVRVQQVAASGREIVLYRVAGGESCIMTTACLLAEDSYLAEGITESEVSAVAIFKQDFDELIARSSAFRRFVFAKYALRITDLSRLLEDVAFQRMDRRLAHKLLDLSRERAEVAITHQGLAVELGSAREVVSRLMKEFTRRGWVRGERGSVHVLDRDALLQLAETP